MRFDTIVCFYIVLSNLFYFSSSAFCSDKFSLYVRMPYNSTFNCSISSCKALVLMRFSCFTYSRFYYDLNIVSYNLSYVSISNDFYILSYSSYYLILLTSLLMRIFITPIIACEQLFYISKILSSHFLRYSANY